MLRSLFKRLSDLLVQHDLIYQLLESTVLVTADYLRAKRQQWQEAKFSEPDEFVIGLGLAVLHGPFKGMRYPAHMAFGSTFTPKIIGSYECELSALIEEVCLRQPSLIVDVGSAEGYYAVGLAMRCPCAQVIAFDVDERARQSCAEMARLNGVSERVTVRSGCDPDELCNACSGTEAFIFCDCEGYEKTLLTGQVAKALAGCEFLVEIHDFIDIEISIQIRERFTSTHQIRVYQSVDDIMKAQRYSFPELDSLSLVQRRHLLAEYRPCVMQWLHMVPIKSISNDNQLSQSEDLS